MGPIHSDTYLVVKPLQSVCYMPGPLLGPVGQWHSSALQRTKPWQEGADL